MAHRADELLCGPRERCTRCQDRRVAVLHTVARSPREVIRNKRVGAAVIGGRLAKHRDLLLDDVAHDLSVRVYLGLSPQMMDGESYGVRCPVVLHGPFAQRERREFGGTVHEVLKAGCREPVGLVAGKQLGRNAPCALGGWVECDLDGPVVEPRRPHECRRHVEVRVALIHLGVRSARPVGEERVSHAHGAGMFRNVPGVGIRSRNRQDVAGSVRDANVGDVLGELVQRVSSR